MENRLLTSVRTRWRLVALFLVLGIAAGLVIALLRPPSYTAQLSMYVAAQSGPDATDAYEGNQLSQNRVISYVELVNNPRVLIAVAQDLHLDTDLHTLGEQISASSKENSVVIDVNATARTPAQAADLANAVGQVFPGVVAGLETPSGPNRQLPVAVRVVEPALTPTRPARPARP